MLRVVLDTDTFNEVDDQFALAHLLMSPDKCSLEAVYAAPFHNSHSTGPGDGMEKSYDEIHRILELVECNPKPAVFRGSTRFLADATTAVESEAVTDLIERAMATPEGETLCVIAIAAATNIASALLLEPRIAHKIQLIWLGGHAPYWSHTNEFNLKQDLHSARILLKSAAPMVLVPCIPVASHLLTSVAELEHLLAPYSDLGRYLTKIVANYHENTRPAWSKVIWDMAATAWAIDPTWMKIGNEPAPELLDNVTWKSDPNGREIQVVKQLHRDPIFADFARKAAGQRNSA